jgi:Zn-finger nucleic acid-binding protein/DNA-directed RNA polymerase subunit RPC12/RpoP
MHPLMNCPNCTAPMDQLHLEGVYDSEIEVDICFACHVLWLDKLESIQLSPSGTLELFRLLHEHGDDARHALADTIRCPRGGERLALNRDLVKGVRFSYLACPARHGRLTPFSEFLKEKQFVRTLTPVEQNRVRAELKSVQCSSCGAPVDLADGFECGHCGSPISVLDADAVEKTLRELSEADVRNSGDPKENEAQARALAAMEAFRTDPNDYLGVSSLSVRRTGAGIGIDLLTASLEMLFRKF